MWFLLDITKKNKNLTDIFHIEDEIGEANCSQKGRKMHSI